MVIYYELYLLINSAIHVLLSRLSQRIMQIKRNNVLFIAGVILLNIYDYLYLNYPLEDIKYLIIFLILKMSFKIKIKDSFKLFIIYYSLNVILGGIYYSTDNKLFLSLIISMLLILYLDGFRVYKIKRNLYYEIKIVDKNKTYNFIGYLDTGNDLAEPKTNIPVVFINKKISFLKNIKIPYYTIDGYNYLNAYLCDNFYIKIDQKWHKRLVYVSTRKTSYECLLNILIFKGENNDFKIT